MKWKHTTWSFINAHRAQWHCVIVCEIAIADSLKRRKNKIKSNPVLIKMPLHWWPLPVIRNRWMWTMSCWACLDWFVYCFAHLLRFFASFLTFAYWLLHYWSHLPNYTLIDSYCQCHATSPSFSMWENVTSTVASERLCHRTDLTRNHCNSLQHLR